MPSPADGGRFRVPGEGLPWPVPLSLLLVATTAGGAAAGAWARPPARPAAAASTSPAEPPAVSAPSAAPAAPPASVTPPAACGPLIVAFAHASATPPSAADAPLAALAAWLAANTDATVVLDGHADSAGSDQGNLALSRSRAMQVANVLAAHGVSRPRMTARGFGAFNPVEGEPDSAAPNRRVVIRVRGGTGCPRSNAEPVAP